MAGSSPKRKLFVSPNVHDLLNGPWDSTELQIRLVKMRVLLEQFVGGNEFVGRMPPIKNVRAMIALLSPRSEEVWEFRTSKENGGLRVIGRFADKDVFVATNWHRKEEVLDPATKVYDNQKVRDVSQHCRSEWQRLFPTYPPKSGETLHDYLSAARILD
jgi:hypothetical protein